MFWPQSTNISIETDEKSARPAKHNDIIIIIFRKLCYLFIGSTRCNLTPIFFRIFFILYGPLARNTLKTSIVHKKNSVRFLTYDPCNRQPLSYSGIFPNWGTHWLKLMKIKIKIEIEICTK